MSNHILDQLKEETGREAIFLELDLASLDKVTKAANEFMSKEPAVHILFNSGGVMHPPIEQLTEDGYDLQFGTNVLGHAHLTLSLLPALLEGAKLAPDGTARVVNTSSLSAYHNSTPLIKWDTLRDGPKRKALGNEMLYNQSKYGNIAFSNELARRYSDRGNLETELQRHHGPIAQFLIKLIFLHPAYLGAHTQLWVATSPDVADVNGGWFIPWARQYAHSKETRNPEVEVKLWDWVEEQRKGH
ncbi:hypothetical protein FRB90_004250 [Tulasnella sp. 427]|nr:hypothetical protein FRB90_004250 [Tulasnella sp. 427]